MDVILKYFPLIAAAVSALNWALASRRLRLITIPAPPTDVALDRRVARTLFGSMIGFFLIFGGLQWAGGYSDPFFPFYDRTSTIWSTSAWILTALLWSVHLIGLWRPGVADAALRLGVFRGPAISARTFRLIATAGLLVSAVVFGTLLLGIWGPVPRPTF
jgi:hypothetical protein